MARRGGKRARAFAGNVKVTARLWDVATGKELCALYSFQDGTSAVVDPEARYDASNDGRIKHLHFVVGNDVKPLHAYRGHFCHPGLLACILGFRKPALPPI